MLEIVPFPVSSSLGSLRFTAKASASWLSPLFRDTLPYILRNVLFLILVFANTQESVHSQDDEIYRSRVKPVLQSRCYACHGALKQEAKLRLDTVASMLTGGESGPAIQAGNANTSLVVQRIAAHEESMRMPPEG